MTPFLITIIVLVAFSFVFVRRSLAVQKVKASSLTTIEGFNPVVKYNGILGGLGLALDPQTSRFAIAGVGVQPWVFDFRQLVAVEVERDGNTVTTTKGSNGLAGAVAGAALLGPAGLLLGAGTRSKGTTTPTVTKLALKIYVNDLVKPCFEVVFYRNSKGGPSGSGSVSIAAGYLDEWYGRFRTILSMQSSTGQTPETAYAPVYAGALPEPESNKGWAGRMFGD